MTNDTIEKWLLRVLGSEGGYANRNPHDDPGGETKWGVSKRSYPNVDIKNLTIQGASEIYKNDFLKPLLKDGVPESLIFQLFDFGIHSGISTAVKCLQKELGFSGKDVDGVIGKNTIAKIKERTEASMVMGVIAARIDFMSNLSNWSANSKGWARRMAANLRYGFEDTK